MKKVISLTVALIMLLMAFAACGQVPPADTSDSDTDDGASLEMMLLFQRGEDTKYKIIYADDSKSEVITAAKGLGYNIEQKFDIDYFEVTAEYSQWGLSGEIDTEILIGDTLRAETEEAKKLLKGANNEYAIQLFDNGKLVFVASNATSLKDGIYYFINTFITNDDFEILALEKGYSYYCDLGGDISKKWTISAPEYEGGVLADSVYSIGANISLQASQSSGKMQVISETDLTQFETYLKALEADGYVEEARTTNNGNIYVQYVKGNNVLYTYFLKTLGEVRVIDDRASIPESRFEYTCDGGEATFYQYGMMYAPSGSGNGDYCDNRYGNNGAFDIIRLADNKLILIDGGSTVQATDATTAALVSFLREITNTPEGEKVTVAAWFLTHAHGDHYQFIKKIASDYADDFVFERIMHNIPSSGSDLSSLATELMAANNDVKFIKLHTGQNITLGNISFDVIMTHEDAVDPQTGTSYIINENNTSTVLKFHINGRSIMYFGDWGGGNSIADAKDRKEHNEMERRLMSVYKTEDGSYPTLEADIVKIAHHGINDYMPSVYAAIKADYAFFSQADVKYDQLFHDCYKTIINQLRNAGILDENIYFAGRKTNWLVIAEDGSITHGEKAIEGADEGYYYYKDSNGATLYDGNGNMIKDTTGDQAFDGKEGVTAVRFKGYWELLDGFDPWNS